MIVLRSEPGCAGLLRRRWRRAGRAAPSGSLAGAKLWWRPSRRRWSRALLGPPRVRPGPCGRRRRAPSRTIPAGRGARPSWPARCRRPGDRGHLATASALPSGLSPLVWPGWRRRASPSGATSTGSWTASSGAPGGYWCASTPTRGSGCAARSSRSAPGPDALPPALAAHGPGHPATGSAGVAAAVDQLQGFERPPAPGNGDPPGASPVPSGMARGPLPLRRVAWGRLGCGRPTRTERRSPAFPSRATPVTLVVRDDLPWLLQAVAAPPGRSSRQRCRPGHRRGPPRARGALPQRAGRARTPPARRGGRGALGRGGPGAGHRRRLRGGALTARGHRQRRHAPDMASGAAPRHRPARAGGRCCPRRRRWPSATVWRRRWRSSCWPAGASSSATCWPGSRWPCRGATSSGPSGGSRRGAWCAAVAS